MKLSILLVVVVATVFGSGFPTSENYNLKSDLMDFVNLLPKQKMVSIAVSHFMNDEEVHEAVNYIMSDDIQQFILDLENENEVQAILRYFQTQGIDVYDLLKQLHQFMGMHPYIPPPNYLSLRRKRSSVSMIEELKSILPMKEIENLKQQKLDSNLEYTSFYHICNNIVYKDLYCDAISSPETKQIINQAESHGFYPLLIHDFIRSLFGFETFVC